MATQSRLSTALLLIALCGSAHGREPAPAPPVEIPLYLEVFVNDHPKHLIAAFVKEPSGRFRLLATELEEIGIDPGTSAHPQAWVYLDTLPGVTFDYDHATQRIDLQIDPSRSTLRQYDLRGPIDSVPVSTPDVGMAMNYTVSGQAGTSAYDWMPVLSGASAQIDGRLFSPLGSLSQSGFVRFETGRQTLVFRRLQSAWSWSDPDRLITARAGDLVSSGPGWTRAIRMAGLQVRRNFDTRPDLITHPLPSFSGTAAVPSSVEVFLGDLRLSSVDVDTGRYSLTEIPTPGEGGDLRIVVRDSAGQVSEQVVPFRADTALLRKGLTDFAIQAGVARTGYGTADDRYGTEPIAVGSLRYGIDDTVTLEGHGEAGAGLVNLGGGAVVGLGRFGRIEGAAASSAYRGRTGSMLSAAYDYSMGSFSINAEIRRKFGAYRDLTDVTAVGSPALARRSPTSYERVYASKRFGAGETWVGLGYTHARSRDEPDRHFASAVFGQRLGRRIDFSLSMQSEFGRHSEYGAYAGLSFALGGDKTGTAGFTYTDDGIAADASVSRAMQQTPGSWGYSATVRKGVHADRGEIRVSRYGTKTRSTAVLSGSDRNLGLYGSVDGGLAVIGGEVYLSRRMDDAFAVVDAGSPGVSVLHENREVGKTGKSGRLLVPDLRSYETNRIAIDPDHLPVHSAISDTTRLVSLPEGSGIVVTFAETGEPGTSAIVVLKDGGGDFLPAGSTAYLNGSDQDIPVGYDGEAYVTGLKARNRIAVDTGAGTCSAEFSFDDSGDPQPRIGPVECS